MQQIKYLVTQVFYDMWQKLHPHGDMIRFEVIKEFPADAVILDNLNDMDIILKIQQASGKPKEEIINFVQSNVISYEDAYKFYCSFDRFPDVSECHVIRTIGVYSLIQAVR